MYAVPHPDARAARPTLLKRHPLAGFVVLAYAISWLIALPLIAVAKGFLRLPVPLGLHYLTAFGPLVAALIMTAVTDGTAGLNDLGRRLLQWRVGLGWLLVAAFSPVALFILAAGVVFVLRGTLPDVHALGAVNYLPNLGIGAWILWILTSGLGEETGWRGYALPRLQRDRSALSATLILALIWVGWHLPFFLYVATYVQLGVTILPMLALGILAGAIVLTWLYNSTHGNILVAVLWHGALNFVTGPAAIDGTISAIVSTAIMLWAVLVVVIYKPATLAHAGKHTL